MNQLAITKSQIQAAEIGSCCFWLSLQVEKTTAIEQNLDTLKELERLCGCSISLNFHFGSGKMEVVKDEIGACIGSPLERLGLFIKDDIEDVDEDFLDGEEGEILC